MPGPNDNARDADAGSETEIFFRVAGDHIAEFPNGVRKILISSLQAFTAKSLDHVHSRGFGEADNN